MSIIQEYTSVPLAFNPKKVYELDSSSFKPAYAYTGQAIHILRNGNWFDISELFKVSLSGATFTTSITRIVSTDSSKTTYGDGNISLEIHNSSSSTPYLVRVKADTFDSGTGALNIKNIAISVIINGKKFVFFVYVHSSITSLWLGPVRQTIHKDLICNISDAQPFFQVLAKFDTGIVARLDQAMYPSLGFRWEFEYPSTTYVDHVSVGSQRLDITASTGAIGLHTGFDLTSLPSAVLKIKVSIPSASFFKKDSGEYSGTGELEITDTYGTVDLIPGSNNTTNNSANNFLIVGEGFSSSPSETALFTKYAKALVKFLTTDAIAFPWKEFRNNYYAYLISGADDTNAKYGEHIILDRKDSSLETKHPVSLSEYVSHCDAMLVKLNNKFKTLSTGLKMTAVWPGGGTYVGIGEYPGKSDFIDDAGRSTSYNLLSDIKIMNYEKLKSTPYSPIIHGPGGIPEPPLANIVKSYNETLLSWLIERVGLPTAADAVEFATDHDFDTALLNKVKEWRYLEGVYDSTFAYVSPRVTQYEISDEDLTDPLSSHLASEPKQITRFIFNLWRKMGKYAYLTPPNTPFGVFSDDGSWLRTSGNIGMKIPKMAFNKHISKLAYNGSNIGENFFTIDSAGDSVSMKSANNIIVLCKPYSETINGNNIPGGKGKINFTDITHRNPNSIKFKCTDDDGKVKLIYSSLQPRPQTLNIILHELCHNYVGDEYTAELDGNGDFDAENADHKDPSHLNLQSIRQLKDPSGNYDAGLTRWNWPRIRQVVILAKDITPTTADTVYSHKYTVTVVESNPVIKASALPEFLLLRRSDLYDEQVLTVCKIVNMPSDNVIVFATETSIDDIVGMYNVGAIMILPTQWLSFTAPAWPTDYLRLIHKDVMTMMKKDLNQVFPIVYEDSASSDTPVAGNVQIPYNGFADLFSSPDHKEKIVGLYAGGMAEGKGYNIDLFHPTGFCNMRSTIERNVPVEGMVDGNYLCPVCRYIITDLVDPMAHPKVDSEFEKDYPIVKS